MILWHLIILAVVQGLTDPLPISSSGHLVLFHHLLDGSNTNPDADRAVDIAVHIGTVFALFLFFWKELMQLFKGGIATVTGRVQESDAKLFQYLVVASVPAVIVGFLLTEYVDSAFFYDIERLAWMSLIFGILLGIADKFFPRNRDMGHVGFQSALIFGVAQCLALVPGVSRSGITMTAGRFMGFDRVAAARFSMLMAIVITSGAGVLGIKDVVESGNFEMGAQFLLAIVFSFFASYAALFGMMHWLKKFDFMPFVVYRVLFGVVVLGAVYAGYLQ